MKRILILMATFMVVTSINLVDEDQWLQAQMVGDTVTLSWTAPTEDINNQPLAELSGYRLYDSPTPGGPYAKIADIAAGNLEYMLAPTEGDHYYVLTAWNSSGESDYSNEVGVTVSGAIARPKAPGGLAAVVN